MSARPPRFARRLMGALLPRDQRDGIVGDLDEVHARRVASGGGLAAWLWYWGQALAISVRLGGEGVAERFRPLASSASLDVRLGLRMLVKYPMLTIVGGLAITLGAAIGVGASEFVRDLIFPTLPLEESDRVVRMTNEGGGQKLYDFLLWKEELESVEGVGASRLAELGLVTTTGESGSVRVAEISASAFPLARVEPQLGRALTEADEREGAPAVMVLGHDTWQEVFGGDAQVLGQVVQLGGAPTTVVGIMPEGFGFPEGAAGWVPLRVRPVEAIPGEGRTYTVFGRLAEGVSLESAQAEVAAVGERTAADFPDVYGQVRAELVPFASRSSGETAIITTILYGLRLFLVILLAVPCINVATLVFARTVTREGEIAVRMALGATRRRIVLQLFAEALVLVGGSTLLALGLARWVLGSATQLFFTIQQEPSVPFGWDHGISTPTILYAGVLALAGALVVGVVPALKATHGAVQPRLTELSTGTGRRLRFGGMWTAIIVFQVALSVAFLPLAIRQAGMVFTQQVEVDFPADQYVTAQLGRDVIVPPEGDAELAEFIEVSRQLFEAVKTRLAADPRVESVAFASGLSAMNHLLAPVEFLSDGSSPALAGGTRTLLVETEYLDMMGATVVAGRGFQAADFAEGSRSVLVNEAFVSQILGDRNAVGGQLRFPEREEGSESTLVQVPAPGESYQIVGVVANPGIDEYGPGAHAVMYAPLSLGPVTPRAVGLVGMPQAPATQIFLRLRPGAEPITSTIYDVVGTVDPSLRVSELGTAEDAWGPVHEGARLGGMIFMAMAGVVLILSVAGIYALMSFTVSQRTREIAIRLAVGASSGRVLRAIFARAAFQLGLGVAIGSIIAGPVMWDAVRNEGRLGDVLLIIGLLLAAGLVACIVPIRRALNIAPASAVKTG